MILRGLLAQEEERNAALHQQLGVAKYWCSSLCEAVREVAQAYASRCVSLAQQHRVRRGGVVAGPVPRDSPLAAPHCFGMLYCSRALWGCQPHPHAAEVPVLVCAPSAGCFQDKGCSLMPLPRPARPTPPHSGFPASLLRTKTSCTDGSGSHPVGEALGWKGWGGGKGVGVRS